MKIMVLPPHPMSKQRYNHFLIWWEDPEINVSDEVSYCKILYLEVNLNVALFVLISYF